MPKTSPYCNALVLALDLHFNTGDRWYWRAHVKYHICAIKNRRDTRLLTIQNTHISASRSPRDTSHARALCFIQRAIYMHGARRSLSGFSRAWFGRAQLQIVVFARVLTLSFFFLFFFLCGKRKNGVLRFFASWKFEKRSNSVKNGGVGRYG